MDVKVITRHGPSNYGSLLQSIATLEILGKLGVSAEIIDYQRKDERGLKATLAQVRLKKAYAGNVLKKTLYVLVRFPMESMARARFDRMRTRYLRMTGRVNDAEGLAELQADAFITGSDQVWGPLYNGKYDPAYFLSFVRKGKKLAYAASFGKTRFSDETVAEYKHWLSLYDAIAVREDSAVKLLGEWGIRCKGQVLDPTLMLDGEQWSRMIRNEIKGDYILVYQIHNDANLNRYAMKLSRHTGVPLVRVSPHLHQARRGGKFVWCPDIPDFLAYVKNCRCLVTDSFHGTCFAINFNRPFLEVLPNTSTDSRNQSILKLTGLGNRIVKDFNDFSLFDEKIDYAKVNIILERERSASLNILKNLLGL